MTQTTTGPAPAFRPAAHQTARPAGNLLHSGNAGLIVARSAQIAPGYGVRAREATRKIVESCNERCAGEATVLAYEEAFGVRDRLHWLVHLPSLERYEALAAGADASGLFGGQDGATGVWDEMFEPGSVRDTLLIPHRWGIFGTATEAMVQDESVSPVVTDPVRGLPRFDVRPAWEQTAVAPDRTLNTATAGVVMRRTVDFDYRFRAEARVFARTVAENMNLNMEGLATVYLYEEMFGRMDRAHFLIHMASLDVMYLLMGLDARTDPDAPRASFVQDWVSMDKGGGAWDRIIVQGSTRDALIVPQSWS
ncbi:DUF6039 family protein [Streptomyces sp. JHA26]|uniref:DUF6039 family protein n=1 Tax=Streptomyces sp. JHA26 TaxID=1917143 RepID=UPI00098AD00B|nr:DUF6039 family protein [Streptomyces sp. JHA26]